ncbi:MAG: DUF835 domain-containing protein [Methanobacteriota archaeon]
MGLDKRGRNKEYVEGYKDGVNATWEEILKMSGKGYTPQEFQIMIKSKRYAMLKEMDPTFSQEAPASQARPPQQGREPDPQLTAGTSYLIKEVKPDSSFAIFNYAMKSGKKGLCVARTPPDIVKNRYKIPDSKIVWLVSDGGNESSPLPPSALGLGRDGSGGADDEKIAPDKLPWIFSNIRAFMDGNGNLGVVILEGLEYLIANNGFKSVLSFVQQLNESAVSTKCILIVPVSPTTMEPKEFAQLEREMGETVDGSQ